MIVGLFKLTVLSVTGNVSAIEYDVDLTVRPLKHIPIVDGY